MEQFLSPDDLLLGDLVPIGWHPCEITGYSEKDAKTDKSTNCIFQFKILDGEGKGKAFTWRFNEKALGFGKTLWAAVGLPKTPEGGYRLTTSLFEQMVGKKVKVYVKRGKNADTGKEFNDPQEATPLTA